MKNVTTACNIVLTGFISTGKSSVARKLGERLGRRVVEVDDMIVEAAGKSRKEIFEEGGEEMFRNIEAAQVEKASRMENVVISCGGGVVLRRENVDQLRSNGRIVLLTASPETVASRTRHQRRTILRDFSDVEAVRGMMAEREPYYRSAADITVETDGKTIDMIVNDIIYQLDGLLNCT